MPDSHLNRSQLFTVRIWLEKLGEGKTEWRGKVQHVPSSETGYFRDWQTLTGHLQTMLVDAAAVGEGNSQ